MERDNRSFQDFFTHQIATRDAFTHQNWNFYLKNIRDVLQTQYFLKLGQKSMQGHSDSKMVRDTPPSQDAFTHQIWNSYLKEHKRYAPDSKQFLETRSEVKVNVRGTQGWCATLCHLKMHPNTKFGIPSLNNIGDMLRTRLF